LRYIRLPALNNPGYVRIKGTWKYLYRAVDKAGATVNFLLTAKRDRKAASRF
jgi:putative transposase